MDVAQEPGLGFLAFWNGAPRTLGNELGSKNRNKSPSNNYFPNAEVFYICTGSECCDNITDSSPSTCQESGDKAFSHNNASTVSPQGDKASPVFCLLKMLLCLDYNEYNIC